MFYNFRKNKKGFTLVELIVVIAILGILAGVAVGAYFGITNSAREKAATNPLKELADFFAKTGGFNDKSLGDYIRETFKDDATSFAISNTTYWNFTGSSTDTFEVYFHNSECGDYYGYLEFKQGVASKKSVSAKKTKPSNYNALTA